MGLAAGQLVADLHEEDAAVLLGNQVFPLLGRLVGVEILKLLGGDEENVLRKVLYGLRIFVPHLMLHVLDNLKDFPHRVHQGVKGALLAGDDPLPVPLVHIAGVEIV